MGERDHDEIVELDGADLWAYNQHYNGSAMMTNAPLSEEPWWNEWKRQRALIESLVRVKDSTCA
jgi:hypothetical protein